MAVFWHTMKWDIHWSFLFGADVTRTGKQFPREKAIGMPHRSVKLGERDTRFLRILHSENDGLWRDVVGSIISLRCHRKVIRDYSIALATVNRRSIVSSFSMVECQILYCSIRQDSVQVFTILDLRYCWYDEFEETFWKCTANERDNLRKACRNRSFGSYWILMSKQASKPSKNSWKGSRMA